MFTYPIETIRKIVLREVKRNVRDINIEYCNYKSSQDQAYSNLEIYNNNIVPKFERLPSFIQN